MSACDNPATLRPRKGLLKPLLGTACTTTLVVLGILFFPRIREMVEIRPWLFPLAVFTAQLLFVPRITMLVASGLLFSPLVGAAFTLGGDTAAAVVVWLWGRWSFGETTEAAIRRRPSWENIIGRITNRSSIWGLALLRLFPFSHFSTVSLASGALGIRLWPFVTGTFLGSVPTALFYAFTAHAIGG